MFHLTRRDYFYPRPHSLFEDFFGYDVRNVEQVENQENKIKVSLPLPGVKKEDVSVSLTGNRLNIAYDLSKSEKKIYVDEKFSRSWGLPKGTKVIGTKASLEDGILSVVIEIEPSQQEKEIKINIS